MRPSSSLEAEDLLHGVSPILADSDDDPLWLNCEPLDERRTADLAGSDDVGHENRAGIDAQRFANLPDQRETPDQE